MQLNSVVFPAPLGPMIPTISHSPARKSTCCSALIPPKWMDRSVTSSTDIADGHLLDLAGVRVEASSEQPLPDGSDLLTDPAGIHRDREQQQDRTDDEGDELLQIGRAHV